MRVKCFRSISERHFKKRKRHCEKMRSCKAVYSAYNCFNIAEIILNKSDAVRRRFYSAIMPADLLSKRQIKRFTAGYQRKYLTKTIIFSFLSLHNIRQYKLLKGCIIWKNFFNFYGRPMSVKLHMIPSIKLIKGRFAFWWLLLLLPKMSNQWICRKD